MYTKKDQEKEMNLVKYLSQLNTTSDWGLWVNRTDVDDYTISQYKEGAPYVCMGKLENLSVGFQPSVEALKSYLEGFSVGNGKAQFRFCERDVTVDKKGVIEAFQNDYLDKTFRDFLLEEIAFIQSEWALTEAFSKVEEFIEYVKEGGEFDQINADLALAYGEEK